MRSVIKGKRVKLRRPRMSDADTITKYCNDRAVSKWITRMPHPYKKKDAVWFIKDCAKKWKNKTDYQYYIEHKGKLIGTVGLHIKEDDKGELGWWIGKSHWGQGFAPEAAKIVMKEAFKTLKLNKIIGRFFEGNKPSERVMKKIGMKYEAWLRDDTKKNGKYVDVGQYCILKREFNR